jgi:hypothetical protein
VPVPKLLPRLGSVDGSVGGRLGGVSAKKVQTRPKMAKSDFRTDGPPKRGEVKRHPPGQTNLQTTVPPAPAYFVYVSRNLFTTSPSATIPKVTPFTSRAEVHTTVILTGRIMNVSTRMTQTFWQLFQASIHEAERPMPSTAAQPPRVGDAACQQIQQ